MSKQAQAVQWVICRSEEEWRQARAMVPAPGPMPNATIGRLAARSRWGRVIPPLLLVALLLTGGWGWWAGRSRLSQHEVELQTALYLEQWAVTEQDVDAARLSLDSEAFSETGAYDVEFERLVNAHPPGVTRSPVTATFELIDVRGDLAVVQVHFLPEAGPAYRQTRFYRRTEQGWLRTAPDPSLWGMPRRLETERLIFRYRERDLPAVTAIAPRADALAAAVDRAFGLPAPDQDKVVVRVSPDAAPYAAAQDGELVRLASPAVALAPTDLDDADLLEQSLALALVQRAMDKTVRSIPAGSSWLPLIDALSLWQLWKLDLPLAGWQEPVTRWVLDGGYATGEWHMRVPPDGFTTATLCGSHRIWIEPAALHIPVTCNPFLPAQTTSLSLDPWAVPLRLNSLTGEIGHYPHPGRVVALATLVDYLAVTYGAETLPALVAALAQHATWRTLIPAVYGVPVTEVQDGWCAYLHDHYGVACPLVDPAQARPVTRSNSRSLPARPGQTRPA